MKIINEKMAYVQKGDIAVLKEIWDYVPVSIFERFIGNNSTIGNNKKNRLDFLIFTNEKEIEFFKNQEWIYDYEKFKNLNGEEIQRIYFDLMNKKELVEYAISKIPEEDVAKYPEIFKKRDMLNHMILELIELPKTEKRIPSAVKEQKEKTISKKC